MMHSTTPNNKPAHILLAILFWIIVWHLLSFFIGQEIFLVSPLIVIQTLFSLMPKIAFWRTIIFSFVRIIGGFLLAILTGTCLAILASHFHFLRVLLYPLTAVIKATPVASFIILALIWIPSKNLSVFIAFLMVFPVVYTNVLQGLSQVDKKLLEMAEVFNLTPFKKALYIYFPSVMPFFISACSISLGLCWKAGIAAEVIGIPSGSIGERLYNSKIYLNTADLFAWTIVIILISMLFERLFLKTLKTLKIRIERSKIR